MFFRRRSDASQRGPDGSRPADEASARTAGASAGAEQARRLRHALTEHVTRANADGGRLPPGAVPTVRDIDDVLRPLLGHVERHPASDEALRGLGAIIDEYLPQALADFTALPARYAGRPGPTGTTPADDLVRQLQLLDEGAHELADLVYTGDAAKLAIQARFLDAKFRRSDLDG
ncbi:conserved hypothetical protein [Frankia canadensis]|uniref:Uncharacterized protein n=1 Tax=Frankia canadensis TaxID=1836972 RepID=A0A2I2KJF7_9ACTN|nr:hypothetical protein [Frankia canadensis]SNQ45784.1 conserved hypothetical protein [Frankia canadensis]SOU53074.1 conserved hypothetical protein [Frankia canadensis]